MVMYFAAVKPWPAYGLVVLLAVTALGLLTTRLNPAEIDSGLGMVLFVHMFLASSGFIVAARRGHFDPVLIHGQSRVGALVAHWCASIAPGLVAWYIVAGFGEASGSSGGVSALIGTRLAALFIVSSLAWVAGFLLPRGGGGVLWMGGLMLLLLRHVELIAPGHLPATGFEVAKAAAALLVCPFLLLASRAPVGLPATIIAVGAAAAILAVAWRAGSGLDIFLAERS